MKPLFIFLILTMFYACDKDNDITNPIQIQLVAHTWILDSSNTMTVTNSSGSSVITRIKGDSTQTLTYHANKFVISDRQATETKKYWLDKFEIHYWDAGYQEYSAQTKHIIGINDTALIEQVISNGPTSTTGSFLFYHAK